MAEPLHEREAELVLLEEAVDAAARGVGGAVLLEGPAGIGKSRLLQEACARASGNARVLRARGDEQARDVVLLPTREMFAPYLAAAEDAELDRAFAGAASLAGPLLGRGSADASMSDAEFALVHGLYWLVVNLAEQRPLVIVVDDLHWVDDSTQRWLAYLLPRLAELPVLVVLAVRPRELAHDSPLARAIPATQEVRSLALAPLTLVAATSLLRDSVPDAEEAFCAAAHRLTGGNPLLLRSLGSVVAERGVPPTSAGVRELEALGSLELGRLVLPRLHGLGEESVGLAHAVAVLGDGVTLAVAGEVAGLDRREAQAALDRLVRAEILQPTAEPAYTHPLVRAIVDAELAPGARASLHELAATALNRHHADPESVARHLAATEPLGAAWATEALQSAVQLALRRGAPAAAVAHYAALLREPHDPESRAGLLLEAGTQAHRAGDPRCLEWLVEALHSTKDPVTWTRSWLALANGVAWRLDREPPFDEWVQTAPDLGDELLYGILGVASLDYGILRGRSAVQITHKRFRRPSEDPPGDTFLQQVWLAGRSSREVMELGDAARAVELARRALVGDFIVQGLENGAAAFAVYTLLVTGQLAEARAALSTGIEESTRRGSRAGLEMWSLIRVLVDLREGEIRSAAAHLLALPEPHDLYQPLWATAVTSCRLEVLDGQDRLDETDRLVSEGPQPGTDHLSATYAESRARHHLAAGRIDEAAAEFERCGNIATGFGCPSSPWYAWRGGLATCLALRGRESEAVALAEEEVDDFRRWGGVPPLARALRALAAVHGGPRGLGHLLEAELLLRTSELRGEHAAVLLDLGRQLRLQKRPAEAREHLRSALDTAERLGNTRLADEAEVELQMAGARPRRRAISGVDALTAAELRVAELAGRGLSNPEIAQMLYITRKTVERHLGSAFLKLHIKSRDQLPRVLQR